MHCCGVRADIITHSVVYVLQVSEGRERSGGRFRNYVHDTSLTADSFVQVCRGPNIHYTEVTDLKPNTCYHFRLSIEYMGTCLHSPVSSIPTLQGVPDPPAKPRVTYANRVCSFDEQGKEPRVTVQWVPPHDNGGKITKYQVQVKEIKLRPLIPPGDMSESSQAPGSATNTSTSISASATTSASAAAAACSAQSLSRDLEQDLHRQALLASITTAALEALEDPKSAGLEDDEMPPGFIMTKWTPVYCNQSNEAIIEGPSPATVKWLIRVRAMNAGGWSEPSPETSMNYKTNPSLFPAGFIIDQAIKSTRSAISDEEGLTGRPHALGTAPRNQRQTFNGI